VLTLQSQVLKALKESKDQRAPKAQPVWLLLSQAQWVLRVTQARRETSEIQGPKALKVIVVTSAQPVRMEATDTRVLKGPRVNAASQARTAREAHVVTQVSKGRKASKDPRETRVRQATQARQAHAGMMVFKDRRVLKAQPVPHQLSLDLKVFQARKGHKETKVLSVQSATQVTKVTSVL
jgi:predicted secreted protein